MNKTEMIKDLFINYIGNGNSTKKEIALMENIDKNMSTLNKILNKKCKKKLNKLCNDYDKINEIEVEQAFTRGFSYAVQLMAEAFSQKQMIN